MEYEYQKFNRMIYSTEQTIDEILDIVRTWFTISGETEYVVNGKKYKLVDNMIVF